MVNKYITVLLTVVLGQTITFAIVAWLSVNAGLGALLIMPIVLVIGIGIELGIIFIKIKDTLIAKLLYALIGLVLSIAMVPSILAPILAR